MDYTIFAFLGAFSVALITLGILSAKSANKKKLIEDENGMYRTVDANDSTVFTAMLSEFSEKLPFGEDLPTRLRKSGWVYKGEMDYHAARMSAALTLFMIPVIAGIILKLDVITVALVATGAAVFGFTMPDRKIAGATKKRKASIQREMGFGLEQISLNLTSGSLLAEALSAAKGIGEFGRISEHIAVGINTNKNLDDIIREVKDDLPEISLMNEFLELVRASKKGQDLVKPFQTSALLLRDRLETEIIEAGGKAKVKVTMLTSAFVMMSSLFVLIGPIFIIMRNTGF